MSGQPTLGYPAPHFDLTAIASQRRVNPAVCRGRAALFVFHNHLTLNAVREVQESVRTVHPSAGDLLVASIVDLSGLPRLLRPLAEMGMNTGYAQASGYLPAGFDAADYVVILPDWSGQVTRSFGLVDVGKKAAIVAVDAVWCIRGRYQGSDVGQAALDLLASLLPRTLYRPA